MAESQWITSDLPVLYLEIQAGQTRFPRRPVRPGRFVLGAHPTCQMQLGGDDMPLIHSLLVTDEAGVVLERIASHPPLLVNGNDVESVEINDGDLIQIGGVCFSVQFDEDFQPIKLESAESKQISLTDPQLFNEADEPELSSLSAAELVDLITADMELVEDFESAQALGLAGMADAALSLENSYEESLFGDAMADFDADDPESIYQHLSRIAEDLNSRAVLLRDASNMPAEQTKILLEQQALLSRQLDSLVNRLARNTIPMRKSA